MSNPTTAQRTGSCLCGAIKYSIAKESLYDTFCHCIPCRKWTGSVAFTAYITQQNNLTITSGRETLASYTDTTTDSGTSLSRQFCSQCGSNLFCCTPLMGGAVGIAAGTLDDFESWEPSVEQYCIRRAGFLGKIKSVGDERRHLTHAKSEVEGQ